MDNARNTDKELMDGYAMAAGRTCADFKSMRDRIGWSQNEAATAMGIDPNTVKKWENPLAGWDVRPYGWAWIDRMYDAYISEVDSLIDYAISEVDRLGIGDGGTVAISYYRNGQAKGTGIGTRHGEPAGAANAVSRAVGEYFENTGYTVRYVWAENGGFIV